MDILPEKLLEIIDEHGEALQVYFSAELLAALVRRNRQHWLVMLAAHLDFDEIERVCQPFHHQSGPGQPPPMPPGQTTLLEKGFMEYP